ncbi:MAG: DUF6384 family protein, partial [Desulfobacterales bacterium]
AKAPRNNGAGLKQTAGDARRSLTAADGKIASLEGLTINPDLGADDSGAKSGALRDRLARRAELIAGLEGDLAAAENAVAAIAEAGVLPDKLAGQRDGILREAKTAEARQQAEALHADAVAALNRGDVEGARQGSQRLQQLYAQLVQEYELRIVSGPGQPSGVWRIPEDNPGARNYYLIVEAVTPRGETLTVPVTSEEDGQTRNVTQWGMRVSADVFEAVRRDKQEDGIVGNRRFGAKQRGDLLPSYLMQTTGGAITEW